MRTALCIASLATLAPVVALAQDPPAIVLNGLEAMVAQGPVLAVDTWFRGSRLETDAGTKQTFVEQFDIFARAAGAVLGHDIVRVHQMGASYSTTYAIIRYERDPLFIVVEVYNGASGWRLMNIEFNDDAEEVFPRGVLEP